MSLMRNHPAIGAYLSAKRRQSRPNWEFIADELAQGLRRNIMHAPPKEGKCRCQDHLSLYVYEEAKVLAHPLPVSLPLESPETE